MQKKKTKPAEKVMLLVRIPRTLDRELEVAVAVEDTTKQQYVVDALRERLDGREV